MDPQKARAELIQSLKREITDVRVLQAMAHIPRERFIPENLFSAAYEDRPLSIGFGQTISQPFIVALMTQALELKGDEKVLELGTGSGYQTAILAELSKLVISVERISQLIDSAKRVLKGLHYNNIEIHAVDGLLGWPDGAPYDAIIVTAGAPRVPDELLEQLDYNGVMVIPTGSRWEQDLIKITKKKDRNKLENLGGCRFVPLIGQGAWED